MSFSNDDLNTLLARLEAAERVIWVAELIPMVVESPQYKAWKRAAGK